MSTTISDRVSTRFSPDRIREVQRELQRWREERMDLLVPAASVVMKDNGELMFDLDSQLFRVHDRMFCKYDEAEQYLNMINKHDPGSIGKVKIDPMGKQQSSLRLRRSASSQLLQRLDVPVRYAQKQERNRNLDLVYRHVNDLLQRKKSKLLLRCLDGEVRAVLSSSYMPLDSATMFNRVLEIVSEKGGEIWDAKLLDDGYHLTAVNKNVSANLYDYLKDKGDHTIDRGPGGGGASDRTDKSSDMHYGMLSSTNHEGGGGAGTLNVAVLRAACLNTLVMADTLVSIRHSAGDNATRLGDGIFFSPETQYSIAAAEYGKLGDAARTAFDPGRLEKLMKRLANAKEDVIPDSVQPREAVQAVIGNLGVSKQEEDSLTDRLLASRDLTRFGLIQALTSGAHECYDESGDKAFDFEKMGGRLLDAESDFERWLNAGKKAYSKLKDEVEEEATAFA